MEKTYILEVPVNITTEGEIIDNLRQAIMQNQKFSIIAININKIMLYQKSQAMANMIKSFDCFIPDGISIVKASKQLQERITGVDLFEQICKKHKELNARIFLYGSKQETVEKTKQNLEEKYQGIQIVGVQNGFVKEDENLIEQMNQAKANILFVAKGSPKQEEWIYQNKDKLNINIFMGVGGSFDVISGNLKRAPKWIRKLGLEWLYRILKEPRKRIKQVPMLMKYWYLIQKEKRVKTQKIQKGSR